MTYRDPILETYNIPRRNYLTVYEPSLVGSNKLPPLYSTSAGVRYRNPLVLNYINKIPNARHRWKIATDDKIAGALVYDFIKRALMYPFVFYEGQEAEAPILNQNDEIWKVLREIDAKDWIMRAGQNQLVHGWQATKPKKNPDGSMDFSNVIGEHEIYLGRSTQFFRYYTAQEVAYREKQIVHQQKLLEEEKLLPEDAKSYNQISEYKIKQIIVTKKPILPLGRINTALLETTTYWNDGEFFHTTNGPYSYGYGNSVFAGGVFDCIVKIMEVSETNHFRQSIWAQALVDPDWTDDEIQDYVTNALYALNNKQLFVNKPVVNSETGEMTDLPLLQFRNAVQDGNPSKSTSGGGGLMAELSSEWALLCAATKYSIRFWTGHPGGALAAASEDTLADTKNDIARFNEIIDCLIKPFLKLLQFYKILPLELDFDKIIIKTWWQVELEKILLAQVNEDAAQNTETEGESKKEESKEKEDKKEKEKPKEEKKNNETIFKELQQEKLNRDISKINEFMVNNGAIRYEKLSKEEFQKINTSLMEKWDERNNKVEYNEDSYELLETKPIKIDKLKILKEIDPSEEKNEKLRELFDETLPLKKLFNKLSPIVVNEELEILDGNHRVYILKEDYYNDFPIMCKIMRRKGRLNYAMPFAPMASSTIRGAGFEDTTVYVQYHSQDEGVYGYHFSSEEAAEDSYQKLSMSTSKGGFINDEYKGDSYGPALGSGKMTKGGTYASKVPYTKYSKMPDIGFFGGEGEAEFQKASEELKEFKMEELALTGEKSRVLGEEFEWGGEPDLKTGALGTERAYYPEKGQKDFYTEKHLYGETSPKAKSPSIFTGTPKRTGKSGRPQKGKTGFQQQKIQLEKGVEEIKELTEKKDLSVEIEKAEKIYREKKEEGTEEIKPIGTKTEPLTEGFKPIIGTDKERTKAFTEIKSLFSKRKKLNLSEIEKYFQQVLESESSFYGRQLGLDKEQILNEAPELFKPQILQLFKNPNNAANILKHSKNTIYEKYVRNEGDFQRYNRYGNGTLESEDKEYWNALVNGMSKTNPFHYVERGNLLTEYQCEESIRSNIGVEVPLGIYHDLENGGIGLPDWQIVGTFKVLAYDEENGIELTHIKTNKRKVKEFFEKMNEHDWITESYENEIVPDISTSYNTQVVIKKLNDGTDIRLQKDFKVKTVSYVKKGNCSGKYCTGDIIRINKSIRDEVMEKIKKIIKKEGKKKYSFDAILKLAVGSVNKIS